MNQLAHNAALAVELAPGLRTDADRVIPLDRGWELARTAPGAFESPAQLEVASVTWQPAVVPGTVAMADPDGAATLALDAWDHWYRCRLERPAGEGRVLLCFDGLATLADVFLDGRLLARTASMFESHAFDVSGALGSRAELLVRFRALGPVLRERRPRGRWPTRLVTERNLRFVRTTLLGYMPGFCPTVRPVGPFAGVRLVAQRELAVERAHVVPGLDGRRGVLEVALECRSLSGAAPSRALLAVVGADTELAVEPLGDGRFALRGRAVAGAVQPWWPHTHGAPHRYPARVQVALAGREVALDLGPVGFRSIAVDHGEGDDFALRVNGERLFCRGAAWTPLDFAALHVAEPRYRETLEQVRAAGMNMLRLSGTMIYESDAFYRLCDELGILVWQDFMFANMDYPADDAFLARCEREASQFLERTRGRACLAMLCGNSEGAQQAAMMGMGADCWTSPLFDRVLPAVCARERPDVPYVPSTPWGGALPFHTGPGPSHYYGVGAYLRPIDDARLRRVRFAAECLAFSIPPEDESLRGWFGDEPVVVHHPKYKARVPRDPGAGWDFADVTDHYVEALFGVEARRLRYADQERYLALARVAAAECMERVQGLWRRRGSGCAGALVWFLRDVWEGAGLGVIDRGGVPKAPYWALRRAWAPRALWLVDEGTDGVIVHAANDVDQPLAATLQLALYRRDGVAVERAARAIEVAPRGEWSASVEALLGRFVDASYAYRFGPPGHALVAARLVENPSAADEPALARAFHLPLGLSHEPHDDVGLSAQIRALPGGRYALDLHAQRFAQSVWIEAPGYLPSDDYFHLAPGERHRVVLAPFPETVPAGPPRGRVRALNAGRPAVIQPAKTTQDGTAP